MSRRIIAVLAPNVIDLGFAPLRPSMVAARDAAVVMDGNVCCCHSIGFGRQQIT
jgi:hypothetical protein